MQMQEFMFSKAFNNRAGSAAQSGFQYVLSPFKTSSW